MGNIGKRMYKGKASSIKVPTPECYANVPQVIIDEDTNTIQTVDSEGNIIEIGSGNSTATVEITPTEISTMHTTPITLVPNVEIDEAVIPSQFQLINTGGTVPYTTGGVLKLEDTNSTNVFSEMSGGIVSSLNSLNNAGMDLLPTDIIELKKGAGLQLVAVAPVVSGDGNMKLVVTYKKLKL